MKRRLLALIALAFVACSPTPSNEEGQVQEAHVDEEQSPLPPTWEPVAFDPESGIAKPNRLFRFVEHLNTFSKQMQKGEYETTKEHQERVAKLGEMIAPVQLNTPYLISKGNYRPRYIADLEQYRLVPRTYCELIDISKGTVDCLLDEVSTHRSTYNAANIFGREVEVIKSQGNHYYIRLNYGPNSNLAAITTFPPHECDVPLEQARATGQNARWGVAMTIDDGLVVRKGVAEESPTIAHPLERIYEELVLSVTLTHLVCFDGQTNKVLYQREL